MSRADTDDTDDTDEPFDYYRESSETLGGVSPNEVVDERGPSQGEDAPRWPTAPERQFDEHGRVTNAVASCPSCDEPSTLTYRCSECGHELEGQGQQVGTSTGGDA